MSAGGGAPRATPLSLPLCFKWKNVHVIIVVVVVVDNTGNVFAPS